MRIVSDMSEADGERICEGLYDILESPIQRATKQIFEDHWVRLLKVSNSEIIQAVWGNEPCGGLSLVGDGISRGVNTTVDEIMVSLRSTGLDSSQERLISIMIHELIVWRLLYMVEAMRLGLNYTATPLNLKNHISCN